MKSYFVFDVESVGLHGEAFAVGGGVYLENGAVQWEFCFNVEPDGCNGHADDRKWVSENIPAMVPTHRHPKKMREAFWDQWLKAKQDGALMAADVNWPVESRFLCACIDDDPVNRMWQGPYPLIDIASVRFAVGLDPLKTCSRMESEKPAHNPLADARQSARLLAEAIAITMKDSNIGLTMGDVVANE